MIVSYLSLALLLSLERGGAIGWRTPPLVIRIITPYKEVTLNSDLLQTTICPFVS